MRQLRERGYRDAAVIGEVVAGEPSAAQEQSSASKNPSKESLISFSE